MDITVDIINSNYLDTEQINKILTDSLFIVLEDSLTSHSPELSNSLINLNIVGPAKATLHGLC